MLALALLVTVAAADTPPAEAPLPADAPVAAEGPAAEAPAAEAPPAPSATDLKIAELTASKPKLWGPIFALILGGVVTLWGGWIATVGYLMSGERIWFVPGSIIGALGLGLDAVGVLRLVAAFRERRAIDGQIEALQGI
jgi:hypothetical protein